MPSTILYKSCEYCGRQFTTIRPDAKYDSDSCRAAASRKRRRYANHEPIPGLRGDFVLAVDWINRCSKEAFRVCAYARRKRGIRACEMAIIVALACCFPGIEDLTHEHHAFYARLIDRDLAASPYPNGNLATGG